MSYYSESCSEAKREPVQVASLPICPLGFGDSIEVHPQLAQVFFSESRAVRSTSSPTPHERQISPGEQVNTHSHLLAETRRKPKRPLSSCNVCYSIDVQRLSLRNNSWISTISDRLPSNVLQGRNEKNVHPALSYKVRGISGDVQVAASLPRIYCLPLRNKLS